MIKLIYSRARIIQTNYLTLFVLYVFNRSLVYVNIFADNLTNVITIHGLDAYWEYRVNVTATTKDGSDVLYATSDVKTFRTAEDSNRVFLFIL